MNLSFIFKSNYGIKTDIINYGKMEELTIMKKLENPGIKLTAEVWI